MNISFNELRKKLEYYFATKQHNHNISEMINDTESKTNKVTVLSDTTSTTKYPANKAVHDYVQSKMSNVAEKNHTHSDNDVKVTTSNYGANINQNTFNSMLSYDMVVAKSKIPSTATSTNQLADKNFVNSSIATNTAYFIGTFESYEELISYSTTLTINDYAFVKIYDEIETEEIVRYDRYKYTGTAWAFEYSLNNSSFTSDQWATINSGLTENSLNSYYTKSEINTQLGNKQDKFTLNGVEMVGDVELSDWDIKTSTELYSEWGAEWVSEVLEHLYDKKQDKINVGTKTLLDDTNHLISVEYIILGAYKIVTLFYQKKTSTTLTSGASSDVYTENLITDAWQPTKHMNGNYNRFNVRLGDDGKVNMHNNYNSSITYQSAYCSWTYIVTNNKTV